MIPLVAMVSLRGKQSRTFRLWIPLVLVWFLLMPLALLLSPVIFVGCLACRVNPFRGVSALWQILSALSRTEFEVDHASAGVSVYIL
jgi:uncharacterized membrane protein